MKLTKRQLLLLTVILALYLFLQARLLYIRPSIWPDEAVYFDIAHNLVSHGRLATDLWSGLVPGVEHMALWNPPVFFLALAAWLKITGFSLLSQRAFSAVTGAAVLLLLYALARRLLPPRPSWLAFLPPVFALADFHFMRATRVSRPEIFVLFFVLASLNLFLARRPSRPSPLLLSLSGLLLSLAILTHPLAAFFLIFFGYCFFHDRHRLHLRSVISFFLGLFLPIIVWLLAIHPYWSYLYDQMHLAAIKKFSEAPWLILTFQGANTGLKLVYATYLAVSVAGLKQILTKPSSQHNNLLVLLATSWFMAIYGRMFWYYVYLVPFVGLTAISQVKPTSHFQLKHPPLAISALFIITSLYSMKDFIAASGSRLSYQDYSTAVAEALPPSSTVYLSAIPDPYYALAPTSDRYRLIEFPVYPLDKTDYLAVLDRADYIVTTGNQEQLIFGSLFPDYIKANSQDSTTIGPSGGYQATIIKLKTIRTHPQTSPRL